MKDMNDDKATRDIIRDSYLDLTDPEFSSATMERVVRSARRRRVLNNLLVNFLVFAAIDSLILLLVDLTGLKIADITGWMVDILNRILSESGQVNISVPGSRLATYLMLSFAGVMVLLAMIELRIDMWRGRRDRNVSG